MHEVLLAVHEVLLAVHEVLFAVISLAVVTLRAILSNCVMAAITSPAAIASSAARAISIVDAASLVTSLDRDDISSLPSIEYRALQVC